MKLYGQLLTRNQIPCIMCVRLPMGRYIRVYMKVPVNIAFITYPRWMVNCFHVIDDDNNSSVEVKIIDYGGKHLLAVISYAYLNGDAWIYFHISIDTVYKLVYTNTDHAKIRLRRVRQMLPEHNDIIHYRHIQCAYIRLKSFIFSASIASALKTTDDIIRWRSLLII